VLRNALIQDAKNIQLLVNSYATAGEMLHLSINEIYEKILEFKVYEVKPAIVGCCAMHPVWDDIAEIRSLAVAKGHEGRGIGRSLVEESILHAKRVGFRRLFTLTYKTAFFESLNFKIIDKDLLPKKVWSDCIKCIKFPNCDEISLILDL